MNTEAPAQRSASDVQLADTLNTLLAYLQAQEPSHEAQA
jgi:hypothetical protein